MRITVEIKIQANALRLLIAGNLYKIITENFQLCSKMFRKCQVMLVMLVVVMVMMEMTPGCQGSKLGPKNDGSDENEWDENQSDEDRSDEDQSDKDQPITSENPPPAPSFPSPDWFLFLKLFLKDLPPKMPVYELLFKSSQKNGERDVDDGLLQLTIDLGLFGLVGLPEKKMGFINNPDYMHEAFNKEVFANRDVRSVMAQFPGVQMQGSIRNNGPAFQEANGFVLSTIKDPEFLRNSVEPRIDDAISSLITKLNKTPAAASVGDTFTAYFQDVLHRIAFNETKEYDFAKGSLLANLKVISDVLFYPTLGSLNPVQEAQRYAEEMEGFAAYVKGRGDESRINENHKASLVRLYSDYITNLETPIAQPEDGWRLVLDLFFASSNSLPQAIRWNIYHLATNQEVQEELRKEINDFGVDVQYDDRSSLPRLMSFLTETFRLYPVAPLGVGRVASDDTKIGDYDITKGTTVMPNLWAIHNNPAAWKDPQVFNATRFLKRDSDRSDLTFDSDKANRVTPFSVGSRSCPGELVARRTIFKTLVNLILKYNMSPMEPDLVPVDESFVLFPPEFGVRFEPRGPGQQHSSGRATF